MRLELGVLLAGQRFAQPFRGEQQVPLVVVHGEDSPPGVSNSCRRIRARQMYVDVALAVRPMASPISDAEKPDAAISSAVRASAGARRGRCGA